jgi:hypothetical protein
MTTKPKADDFDAAFAQASKDDDAAAAAAAESAQGDGDGGDEDDADAAAAAAGVAEEEADAAAAEAAKGGEDADAGTGDDPDADTGDAGDGGEKGGKEDDAAKTPPPEEPALTNEELLARMSELLGKGSAEQHQQQQQKDPPAKAQPDAEGAKEEKQEQQPLYTPEEEQLLEAYRNDWPDIARAEALSRRQEYQQLLQFVFSQVKQVLDPISETVDVISNQAHLQQLQTQIADYDDVRDKVVQWVEGQPAYLRAAYEHVITQGTAEEVADLVERYRKENGIEAPKAKASSGEQQQQSQDTELPAATKKAAAGLAPVRSKRSTPSGSADPADFDAAFAEFAKKI